MFFMYHRGVALCKFHLCVYIFVTFVWRYKLPFLLLHVKYVDWNVVYLLLLILVKSVMWDVKFCIKLKHWSFWFFMQLVSCKCSQYVMPIHKLVQDPWGKLFKSSHTDGELIVLFSLFFLQEQTDFYTTKLLRWLQKYTTEVSFVTYIIEFFT